MPLKPHEILDAMPETKKYFKRRLLRAPVDYDSFLTPLQLCNLDECCGMCCYDGVCVDDDELHYIKAVMDAHPKHFKEIGLTSDNAFEGAEFLGAETMKTKEKKFKYPKRANFPKHFRNTACVFRYDDGKCSLQALAMQHGEHPWAYKPFSCWLHPISLERDDKTILWIPRKETDHLKERGYPGYAPYTGCGCEVKGGKPAYRVLKEEIKTLSAIVGRDFYGEMKEYDKKRNGQ